MPVSGALIDGGAIAPGSRPGGRRLARDRCLGDRAGHGRRRRRWRERDQRDGLAQDQPGAARFDLQLGQVRAFEERGQPIDEREQLDVADLARLGRVGGGRVVGHRPGPLKMSAVF